LLFSIFGLLAIQQSVIHGQVHRGDHHVGRRPDWVVLTQPLFHTVGIQRLARIEQARQRRLHPGLTLACRQVQDSQILLGCPSRLLLHQQVVGHAEAAGGEQVGPIAVVGERSRLAHQPVDDVPVVDLVLAASAQTGQFFHPLLGVEDLDPLGVQSRLDPLADQPTGHRVDVPFHPHDAARFHAHTQPFARFQAVLWQRT
jgi:hypothetical protein